MKTAQYDQKAARQSSQIFISVSSRSVTKHNDPKSRGIQPKNAALWICECLTPNFDLVLLSYVCANQVVKASPRSWSVIFQLPHAPNHQLPPLGLKPSGW